MTRSNSIIMGIGITVFLLLLVLYVNFVEHVEKEVSFGYSPQAYQNDLLAARRFLKRMGIPAENMPAPSPALRLPDHDEVILINTKRLAINERTQQVIFDWVKKGGHLIFSLRADTVYDGLGDIFERFNEIDTGEDSMLKELGIESGNISLTSAQRKELGQFGVDFSKANDFVWVAFKPELRITKKPVRFRSLSGDQDGDTLITGRYGAGYITIFSDRNVLHNRRIKNKNHAAFLWHMVNLHSSPARVWLVADDDMPGMTAWLWKHARELVISLALLLVMTLLTLVRRFGPVIDVVPPVRRRLLEHIQASGWFLWRFGHADQLLSGMQQNLKHDLAIKHPGLQTLSPDELAGKLSEIIDLPQEDIRRALSKKTIRSREDFTQTVRLYERLRKQL